MTSITKSHTSWWLRLVQQSREPVNNDAAHRAAHSQKRLLDVEKLKPPAPTSVIEQTALQLNRALEGFTNQETILVAEIAAKTELLRQVRAAKLAVSTGLEMIEGGPALGAQTVPTDVADQMEAAISRDLSQEEIDDMVVLRNGD